VTKIFERSTEGLRDALMCEMEDIRAGIANPAEATAFALLAKTIVSSIEVEINEKLRIDAKEERAHRRADAEKARLRLEAEREKELQLSYAPMEYEEVEYG
jgi:hypothetical protein